MTVNPLLKQLQRALIAAQKYNTEFELSYLLILIHAKESPSVVQGRIADALGWSPTRTGKAVTALGNLKKTGPTFPHALVTVGKHMLDHRHNLVTLTPEGDRVLSLCLKAMQQKE